MSGNVSLYNETDGTAILPTPNVGGLGLIEDLDRMVGIGWPEPGLDLVLLGECLGWLGSSLYWQQMMGRDDGAPPPVDLGAERRTGEFVLAPDRRMAASAPAMTWPMAGWPWPWPRCAWPAPAGPRSRCRAEATSVAGWWFGEDQGRYMLAVPAAMTADLLGAAAAGGMHRPRGRAQRRRRVDHRRTSPPYRWKRCGASHEAWLPSYMAAEAG